MKEITNMFEFSSRNLSHILASVAFLLIFIVFGCTTLQINSKIRSQEVVIDGKSTEWIGAMSYIEDKQISVGIVNDKENIYVCMITENQLMRNQMMMQGFTVWLDPAGGKKKSFGIKFPLGRQGEIGERMFGGRERPPDPKERDEYRERMRERQERAMTELEVIWPEKDEMRRMPVEEAKGIEVKLGASSGVIVYELKVPILRSEQHPYAVEAKAGDSIGIGLEISQFKMSGMRRGMGGGMPGGGRGGMGGMGGRGGGMVMGGGMRPQIPAGLKVWMKVQLATEKNFVSKYLFMK